MVKRPVTPGRLALGLFVLVALMLAGGCRKKSAPQFYELESTSSILIAREGDDAWESDEMDRVLEGLKAIPTDALEADKVSELIKKIEGERARLKQERASDEADTKASEAKRPQLPRLIADVPEDAGSEGEVDAGPDLPYAEMPISLFNKRFGACMEPVVEGEQPNLGKVLLFTVRSTDDCRARFKVPADSKLTYVFKDGVLRGERTERRTDAGLYIPPPPPPPPVEDAGPAQLQFVIPGTPAPQPAPPQSPNGTAPSVPVEPDISREPPAVDSREP